MTSQTGRQIITIYIMPNILRGNDNQTMKFGQLMEYNMSNTFPRKSYAKCGGGELFGRSQYQILFYKVYIKLFKKQKELWNQSPYLIFCMIFEEKYFSRYILLTDQMLLLHFLYFLRYRVICVLQLSIVQSVTQILMSIIDSLSSQRFFQITKKSAQKCKYLNNENSFQGKIKSIFHHFQRDFNCQKLKAGR